MAQVKDPACGMTIDSTSAAGHSEHHGQTYYFCSTGCKQKFDANPGQFVGSATGARRESEHRPDAR